MEASAQSELRERILADLASGTDPMCARVMLHRTDSYVDPVHLAAERATVFTDLPLVVASSDQLRRPGDFVTDDLSGRPLLVVRGDDGVVRAFSNVCGHRGSKVEAAACGNQRRFTCPYHAWSYDRGGHLRAIPNDDGFIELDRDTRSLAARPVAERHGLVWVHPTAAADEPLDIAGFLGTLDAELAGFGMDAYVHERAEVLRRPFNWKLVIDGFLESYHLRFLHRTTIGPYIRANFALSDEYGRHARMVALRSSFDAAAQAAGEQDLLPHIVIIYLVFPNSVLVWQGDHFEAWSVFPDGPVPDRMVARATLLAPTPPTTADDTLHWDKNWKVLMDTVQQEDWAIAKTIQDNIAAGARGDVVFGRQEATLQHFHSMLGQATAAVL